MTESETFLDAMRATAARFSDGRGIRFYTDQRSSLKRSYVELDERARARAVGLAAAGYRPGEVAVLAFNPGFGFIEAVYAALYAGMTIAPVPVTVARNPRTVVDRIAAILADSGSRLLLTEPSAIDALGDASFPGVDVVELETDPEPGRATQWVEPPTTPDSIALLQYTSGSTGAPKGVVVSHANLVANQESIGIATDAYSEAIWAGWLPHYHDMGLIGLLLRPIYSGAESILTSPSQFLRRPLLWLRLIAEHRATFTVAPDFAYRLCTRLITDEQLAELDLSSLRHVVTGAEPVRIDTIREFVDRFGPAGVDGAAFVPAYGMAETTLFVSASVGVAPRSIAADVDALGRGELVPATDGRALDIVSCGRSTQGTTIAIVDPATGRPLPDGLVGEINVAGASVTLGYWGRPEETSETFGTRLEGLEGAFLRTGDLGAMIDGELYVTGRIKDLIIVRGRNVYPQDLELAAAARVEQSPGCLNAAFELEGQPSEVALLVELDPRALNSEDLPGLAARLRAELTDEFGLPSLGIAIVRKGILPRTTSGKIQRRLARIQLLGGELPVALLDGLTIDAASEQRETAAVAG